ncbi:MAG: alkaline phosphatase family protein [Solirubrobacteraceae bacterium]
MLVLPSGLVALTVGVVLLGVSFAGGATPAPVSAATARPAAAATSSLSSVRHVFVIVLENESASTTFGPNSPAPYLAKTLTSEGAYLPKYYAIGHQSNDNYIAMISGQAPNTENQADCQDFDDIEPGTIGSYGQAAGEGCVYPATVPTIASQLTAAGYTWRDYNESMGNDPTRESSVCGHPALNSKDGTQSAEASDMYATRHNPFVYFHSIIDDTTLCDTHVVNLDQLPQDLSSAATTANYSFITPDLCDDGHDSPCANGSPGGLAQVNKFLQSEVPQITGSTAFKQNGLLIVTFDEAATEDASDCCGEIPGPGSPEPGATGPGGGDIGTVLLSPCITPGTVSQTPYNHYTMLGSVENIFGLSHIGYAGLPGETYFASDIFNRPCGGGPPVAQITAPPLASTSLVRARLPIRWSATAGAGESIVSYTVQDLDLSAGAKSTWKTLVAGTSPGSRTFVGKLGHTYGFRVQAVDDGGQASPWATATTVIPSRARVSGGHYSKHWRFLHRRGAWEQHVMQTYTRGASFKLRFKGGTLTLIGDLTKHGGTAHVTVDGRTRTIHLHANRLHRRRAIFTDKLKYRVHRVRIVDVRGLVALEGFGIASRTS